MRSKANGLVAVLMLLAPTMATATEKLWPAQDPTYTFKPGPGCDRPQPVAMYNPCQDQMVVFQTARTEAAKAGQTLLVVFGAAWCPSCRGLETALPLALAETAARQTGAEQAGGLRVVEIAVSTLMRGKVTAVPSGEAVMADLMRARPEFRQNGIPFVAFVDPISGRTSARNLDDLEQRGSWSPNGLARIVASADAEVRGGPVAPGAPGWLARKWKRVFGE